MSEEIIDLSANATHVVYELSLLNSTSSANTTEESVRAYRLRPLEAYDSWKQYLLTSVYTSTSVLAFAGNLVSIVVLVCGKRSSPELKKYLINLAISDILMALFAIPFTYTDFMSGRWLWPDILCPFAQFITIFSLCASVATLTAVALERYLAIMHPLRSGMTSKYRSMIVMAIIWSMATALASPQLFTTQTIPFRYGNHSYRKCREVADRLYSTNYSVLIFVTTFVIPFATLLYVYGSIGLKMCRKQIPGLDHQSNNSMVNKLKAVKISAVVVTLFIVCWLPIQLFNLVVWFNPFLLIRTLGLNSYMTLFFVCHWIMSAHSMVNPIIYCFMSANFREDFHNTLKSILPESSTRQTKIQCNGRTATSVSTWPSTSNETFV